MLRMAYRLPVKFRLSFVATTVLAVAALFLSNVSLLNADSSEGESRRLTPQSIQADRAASVTPTMLVDRDTESLFTADDDTSFIITLDSAREVQSIKLYGSAPYTLSVKAERDGLWDSIDGLDRLDLRNLSEGWHRFDADAPVVTGRLQFNLTSKKGGQSAVGLAEIEVWGRAEGRATKSGRDLLQAVQGDTPPDHARLLPASPSALALGSEGAPESTTVSIPLEYSPQNIRRAWLYYELKGAGHWVTPVRAINGESSLGGHYRIASSAWTTQLESVNPAILQD